MMRRLSTEEIQQHLLKILEAFDRFAKENRIVYYLVGGTLLGAVRHHGFIPWDDDVDLMVPRDSYRRLIKVFRHEKYKLICCEKDKTYGTPFLRIYETDTLLRGGSKDFRRLGVFIDVFPIDGYPGNTVLLRLHALYLRYIRAKINMANRRILKKNERFRLLKKIFQLFLRHDGNYYSREINRVGMRYRYDTSKYVGLTNTIANHMFKEINSKAIFDKTVYLPFEHLMLPAPAGYDDYLRHLWGDYMKLPPKGERHTEHEFTVWCEI